MEDDYIIFFSGEGEGRLERRLKKTQVTAERLAQMFGFDVTGIHIVEEFGSSTEWPNRDGRFDLADFRRECTLKVEGNLRSIHAEAANPRPSPSSAPSYSPLFSSVFSNLPHSSKRAKVSWYSLKVTLATLEKGKVKDPSRQVYILITDETANVAHIKVKCQEELGISNIKLVSANGLPFEDSDGTRGLAFWKTASRKVFAIDNTKNADEIVVIKDEGEEHVTCARSQDINIEDVKDTVRETVAVAVADAVKKEISDGMQLIERKLDNNYFFIVRAVQNSILKEFLACFECLLCKETAAPPVIVSTCCESVIGCEDCVTRLFQSGTSACPKCRSAEFIAVHLRGFDIITRLRQSFVRTI